MKILLIANYLRDEQQSMQRFASMLETGLSSRGHEVRISRPRALFGNMGAHMGSAAKWLGYVDKFLLYPMMLRREAAWADVVHVCDHSNAMYLPHVRTKANVITCHDLLAIRAALGQIAEHVTKGTGRLLQWWILRNLRNAKIVACVSEKTRADLVDAGKNEAQVSVVIPNAMNYPYRRLSEEEAYSALGPLGIAKGTPFFFHVGGNQWYKNRAGVIRIFSELAKYNQFSHFHLVMAGKPLPNEMMRLAAELGVGDKIIELANVTNAVLAALYSTAEGLIFPSLQEGFGWPIVEAQASGCLVVTSNRSPMTEVAGTGAIFVKPDDPVCAAKGIAERFDRRSEIVSSGTENAKLYAPEVMIAAYEQIYDRAIKDNISKSNATR